MTRTAEKMNRIPFLMLLSTLLAVVLLPSPRLHAVERTAETHSLVVDCDKRFVRQRQASWLLGTDNFSQTYARRAAIYAHVARACTTGVTRVRVEGRQDAVAATWSARR